MKIMQIPLTAGEGQYLGGQQFDNLQTVNMFLATTSDGKSSGMVTIPGTKVVYTNAEGKQTRQLYENGTAMFAVYGNEVVAHDTALVPTPLGNLKTSTGYVAIKDNNSKQVVFIDGVDGWVYDFSSTPTFTKITATAFTDVNNPIDCDYLDGHIFVGFGSTNKWIISDLGNAKLYSALNFAFLTSDGNEVIRGLRIVNRRIFIFGRQITEIWYPTGAPGSFPYKRDNNSILQYGCQATGSIAVGNLSSGKSILVWLASERSGNISVRVSQGGMSEKISTPAIDWQMQSLTNSEDARGYVYRIEGHTFYLLNFSIDDTTFVYDFDTELWHEQSMPGDTKYFSLCHAFFNNTHYLGHFNDAKLSVLDSNIYGNNGEGIFIKHVTPSFSLPSYERSTINRLWLQMRNGLGTLAEGADNNPLLYISHSNDGGYTFSNQRPVEIGKLALALWEVLLTGFAMGREHTFKIECFNAVRNIIQKGFVEIENNGV